MFPELNYKQNYEDPENKTLQFVKKKRKKKKNENCVVVWNLDYTLKQGFDFSPTLSTCYLFIFLKLNDLLQGEFSLGAVLCSNGLSF